MIDLGWWATGLLLAAAFGIFLWSRQVWMRPPDPLRPRLLNHGVVQLLAMILMILMLVHMVTLIAGQPLTGRR
ncbi:hypothetical protein sos41_12280 [Alphaproteobacteria bacterium SO-S41]|nr:hypothetical protein sos41_12280 [Alphaproteobacteria bacterium SO-S41]